MGLPPICKVNRSPPAILNFIFKLRTREKFQNKMGDPGSKGPSPNFRPKRGTMGR